MKSLEKASIPAPPPTSRTQPPPAAQPVPAAAPGEVLLRPVYVWQLGIRVYHWVTAGALAVLFLTGMYIAYPVFASTSAPELMVMSWMRELHFSAGYVLLVMLAWRIYCFAFGNKYARSGTPRVWSPRWWKELIREGREYLRYDFSRPHTGHNELGGASYVVFVLGLGALEVLTGFALYGQDNPGGFWDTTLGWVVPLCGGSFRTRTWHHLFAWGFVVFTILHLYIVWIDARQYRNGLIGSIITGYKFQRVDRREEDEG